MSVVTANAYTRPLPGIFETTPVVTFGPVTTTLARQLRALRRAAPTVVVAAPTMQNRLVDIADAVLDGLGKGPELGGGRSATASVLAQAAAWLTACGISDVIVADAELLSPRLASEAGAWLIEAGVRPWFVACSAGPEPEPLPARAAELVGLLADTYGVVAITFDDLTAAFPALAAHIPEPGDPPPIPTFPRVPRADGLVFRSAAKAVLADDDFAVVEARLVEVVAATRQWCVDNPQAQSEELMAFWRALVEQAVTVDEVLVVTRGVQVGAFTFDWLVKVDTDQLLGTAAVEPREAVREAEPWWPRFLAYRTTMPGALAALYSAGISLEELEVLTLGAVCWDRAAGTVTVAVPRTAGRRSAPDPVTIAGEQATLVAAHAVYRQMLGAEASEAFFTGYRGQRLRTRSLGDALAGPTAEIGVTVARQPSSRKRSTAARWAARHGVSAKRLTYFRR